MTLSCFSHVKRTAGGSRPVVTGKYSDTVFHGDNSGSMSSMGSSPEDGGREFAKEYRDFGRRQCQQGTTSHLTYSVFSTKYHQIFSGAPADLTEEDIDKCAKAMRATDSTKFFDTAVGQIASQAKRVRAAYDAQPLAVRRLVPLRDFASVVFATLTDGKDNESVLCTGADLRTAFAEHKATFGAKILFLAANMDAQAVGARYGLDAGQCLQMGSDPHYSGGAMRAVTQVALREASGSLGGGPRPPMFGVGMRQQSCGGGEFNRYTSAPVHGLTMPNMVPRAGDSIVSPQPSLRVNGVIPPMPSLHSRVNNLRNSTSGPPEHEIQRGQTAGSNEPLRPRTLQFARRPALNERWGQELPLSDDDLSDSESKEENTLKTKK